VGVLGFLLTTPSGGGVSLVYPNQVHHYHVSNMVKRSICLAKWVPLWSFSELNWDAV